MANRLRTIATLAAGVFALGAYATQTAAQTMPQEVSGDLMNVHEKIVGLAETVPEDLYDWRPAEGVRSIGEVYMHIASANFRFPGMLGVSPPEGTPESWIAGEAEGVTREEAVRALNASFSFMNTVVSGVGDVNRSVRVFNRPTNVRGFLLTMTSHLHEHLGQSIAYARMNGVTPPWNME